MKLAQYVTKGPSDGIIAMAFKRLGCLLSIFLAFYLPTVVVWSVLRIGVIAAQLTDLLSLLDHVVYFPYWIVMGMEHTKFGFGLASTYTTLLIFGFLPACILYICYRVFAFFFALLLPRSWRQSREARVAVRVNGRLGSIM